MRKITSFLLIVVFLIIPVGAASSSNSDVEYIQKSIFWTWAAGKGKPLNGIIGNTFGAVCPNSEDGYHHASSYKRPEASWGGLTGYYKCICDLCGAEFKAYKKDLQQSYETQVEELPAPGYQSDGALLYSPTHKYLYFYQKRGLSVADTWGCPCYIDLKNSQPDTSDIEARIVYSCESSLFTASPRSDSASFDLYSGTVYACYDLKAPIDGYYIPLSNTTAIGRFISSSESANLSFSYSNQEVFYSANYSTLITLSARLNECSRGSFLTLRFYTPVYKITPVDSLIGEINTIYNITTRPTSITGDYGIIGDNGQIIKVEGDKIVNETNNTIYNPATGQTTTITDWSYNYEDRSYTVTTETGDTITITYGDENVVIKEGNTTYNIYYLVDGSGEPGPDVPPTCDHTWTETSRTDPACSTPGKVTSTCSKCNQTKTQTIPALGHSWAIDRTVQTTYDEEGNLLQQGYTIYSCSVCGEQYKDMEGTGPPGGEEE